MSTIPSILVGIDYSPSCGNALREAARLSNAANRPLVCYHVLDEEILSGFRKFNSYDEGGIVDYAREKLEKFIQKVIGAAHEIHTAISIGHPFEETLKMIEEHHAEMLVLGSKGLSRLEGSHVGRLASRCLGMAPVEVLLVRKNQDHPFRVIAAGVDFSENSIRAARRAAEIARQDSASLRLIHVYRPVVCLNDGFGGLGSSFPVSLEPSIIEEFEARLEKIGYELGKEFDLQELSTRVLTSGRVSHEIETHLEEMNADLIVLGTRGRAGFKRLLLGTTAESIMSHTSCSALAVKPGDFHL